MDPFADADDFLSNLPPLSDDEHTRRLVDTFSVFIETLDTNTLDYLRTMFVKNFSSDPQHGEFLDVLDGERLLRN
jgi:hypothetical protein